MNDLHGLIMLQVSHFLPLLSCLSALLQGKDPFGGRWVFVDGSVCDRIFLKLGGWRNVMVGGRGTKVAVSGDAARMGYAM